MGRSCVVSDYAPLIRPTGFLLGHVTEALACPAVAFDDGANQHPRYKAADPIVGDERTDQGRVEQETDRGDNLANQDRTEPGLLKWLHRLSL